MRTTWVGWAVLAGALSVFGLLAWQIQVDDSQVWRFDRNIAAEAKQHADQHADSLAFAREITHVGGTQVMASLAVVGALLLCMCGQPKLAAVWLLATALGAALDLASKDVVERPRPDKTQRDRMVSEDNFSFPSGHAMSATVGFGTLACVGFVLLRRNWAKLALAAFVAAVVLVICWTRIYLRAHWCSDVIGGVAIGLAWLWLCITAARAVGLWPNNPITATPP